MSKFMKMSSMVEITFIMKSTSVLVFKPRNSGGFFLVEKIKNYFAIGSLGCGIISVRKVENQAASWRRRLSNNHWAG